MPLPARRPDDQFQSPASAPASYTVSRLIAYFAITLPASSNYPRHARAYLDYCLQQGYCVDRFSLGMYTTGFRPNRILPLRKFLFFY